MDFNVVKEMIERAFVKLYVNDDLLFAENVASEGSIVFRIGMYMNNYLDKLQFDKNIVVDCEYNRVGDRIKMGNDVVRICPDLIIHERRNCNNNLACFEFKKYPAKSAEKKKDYKKLACLTTSNGSYGYTYGFFIEIQRNKVEIVVFQEGEERETFVYKYLADSSQLIQQVSL